MKDSDAPERNGTRDRVLAEAETLLIRGGYATMSLEAVAQAVGIRKASLYHHFPDGKEALLVAMVEARTALDGQLVRDRIAASGSVPEKLRAVIAHFAGFAGRRPYRAFVDAVPTLPPSLRGYVLGLIAERIERPVRSVIESGIASGALGAEDPEIATRIFFDLLRVLGSFDGDPRAADLPERLLRFYLRGLGTADPGADIAYPMS